ncbi:MAG: hypothetical protein HY721_27730, partial [Planctomycetes bacterium]|nr:hypothetical protein [Planctomycetota bacterium]
MLSTGRLVRRLAARVSCALVVLLLAPRPWAQEAAPGGPAAPGAEPPRTAPPPSDAYRPLGPELFPFYQHYLRTADSTEIRNVLYLYGSTEDPRGNWSRFLAPLFLRAHEAEPRSDLLFLFPLLFFHKGSDEESFNYWIPLFYDRRTPSLDFQFLFPLWLHTKRDEESRHHVLFPLFRHRTDQTDPSLPVTGTRLGLWKVVELWESRFEPGAADLAALSFFNWGEQEARRGFPLLFQYSWAREGEALHGHTHVLPLYWHTERPGLSERWIVPFFGYWVKPGEQDLFLIPALSGFGGSSDGSRRLQVLFPLSYYARAPRSLSFGSFPLFGYRRTEAESSWNVLFWPYRTTYTNATGKRTHSFLYPLSSFDVEPDGSKGSRWLFPYIETFDDKRLWRFVVPVYYEYQALAGGSTDWFFRLGLPAYVSWGYPEDSFSMGFPLYWATRDGPRGWEVLFPLYWRSYSASSLGLHVVPLVSFRKSASRTQVLVGGPLYVHERFRDLDGEPSGTGNHLLWPFFGLESRKDGHLVRALPFFAASRDGETRDLLLTPFFYQQEGPRGSHWYLVPFYGRYESPRIERDFYAAASYMRTREHDDAGRTTRRRTDVLWSLISHEAEETTGASHTHVLPLGYWSTATTPEDRTVAGPFYYSHRIADGEEQHHLTLVLGNLLFSRSIDAPAALEPAAPDREKPGGQGGSAREAGSAPADDREPLHPLPPDAGRPLRRRVWSDQGVLWPLARRYRSDAGREGEWIVPFYFNSRDPLTRNAALFPFFFVQEEETPYQMSFFRYFFLYDHENWRGGYRRTVGQLLFDWKAEQALESYRLRLLYPLLEYGWGRDSRMFQLTPFFRLSRNEGTTQNWLFPIYWQGSVERKTATGESRHVGGHFFLFPFFGLNEKATRTDYYVLFPFFHLQDADDAFRFELWPSFFYRDEPSLLTVRLWPLHADETGATAGDFWISHYLFLSKRFETLDGFDYRLDPFLFRASSGPERFGIAGLFEAFAYDR